VWRAAGVLFVVAALAVLRAAVPEQPPVATDANRFAEPTRGILAQHCGHCHLPNLPTSVPRALTVFDLTEEPWYGRLTDVQLESMVFRVSGIDDVPETDRSIVESFVRCAREHVCPQVEP
jgi:hypothetical protein